jgi:UDP-GlcNAc:undecaprenyl-phosphate GlcNAc-1-phosphate transferase
MTNILPWFLFAFVLSLVATKVTARLATNAGIVDRPTDPRKVHTKPIPLLGGAAIFVSIAFVVLLLLANTDALTGGEITIRHYLGFLLGGLVLMIGGYFDDRYNLPPRYAFISPVIAAFVAITFGIEVEKLTNPFGGVIYLSPVQSDVLVFVWLLVVMYTTKFLDGLDGLAAGVTAIGSLMVMLLALSAAYFQPDVALLAAIALGALLGFLVWNFYPASVFLGEGGSTFVGYLLGTLAVISGGKLATALLVLGIPLFDAIWVVLRRMKRGGLAAAAKGDRKHLHHRLLDLGWSQRRIVLAFYVVAAGFGVSTLFLQSKEKLIALGLLTLIMILVALALISKEKRV